MNQLTDLAINSLQMLVRVRDLVTNSDVVSGAVLDLVLIWLGKKVIGESKKIQLWAGRLAFICLLAFATDAILQASPASAGELIQIAIMSIIAGGLALGVFYLVLPVITFLWQHSFGTCARLIQGSYRAAVARYSEFCRSFSELEFREQQFREQEKANLNHAARKQADKESAEKAQIELEKHRRHQDLCYGIQLFYDKHSPELANRFPPERFSDVVATYLSKGLPLEVIEQRATQLFETLRDCVRESGSRTEMQFASMSDIAKFYSDKRQEITKLGYDDETLETFRIAINQEEDEAIRRFLGAS